MKSVLLFFLTVLVFNSGCKNPAASPAAPVSDSTSNHSLTTNDSAASANVDTVSAPIATVIFDCDSGNLVKISFWNDRCHLSGIMRGKNYDMELAQTISGSGVIYSDGIHTVWNKGNQTFINMGDGNTFNCNKQ